MSSQTMHAVALPGGNQRRMVHRGVILRTHQERSLLSFFHRGHRPSSDPSLHLKPDLFSGPGITLI